MDGQQTNRGPLAGLRVVEFASIGPGPHCAMLLGDLGAEVLRIERPGGAAHPNPIVDRGRTTKALDIRTPAGRGWALGAIAQADVLIEGMRPGVMERLGLGPEDCQQRNSRLVYGRMTGWGQTGPMKDRAGHDINYIGLTGALAAIGRPGEAAAIPLNLVGDFGGGSMLLAFGLLAALLERERSGQGQVVDAAIIDGVTSMMGFLYGLERGGGFSLDRESSMLGGAAPFYRTYLCADGKEIAVGAIEPQFYAELVARLACADLAGLQHDRASWPRTAATLARTFLQHPRDHWAALFADSDACVTPVLDRSEIGANPQMAARGLFAGGVRDGTMPPVPRFSRSAAAVPDGGGDPEALLASWRDGG